MPDIFDNIATEKKDVFDQVDIFDEVANSQRPQMPRGIKPQYTQSMSTAIPQYPQRQAQENPILTTLRQPSQMLNKGVSQLGSNPLAGVANIASSFISTVALPFSVGDSALRQVPVIGEPTANAIALPFQAIGKAVEYGQEGIRKGLDAVGLSNYSNPDASQAISGLNQGLAQFMVGGKVGSLIPKTTPTFLDVNKISPKAEALGYSPVKDKILSQLPPEKLSELTKAPEVMPEFKNSNEAIEFGKKATPEQVSELQNRFNDTQSRFDELQKSPTKENRQERIDIASQKQFYNEALQTAKEPNKLREFEQPQTIKTPVDKIIDILGEAKPIRKAQEKLYSQRRSEQLPALSSAFKSATGEESAVTAKGVLKGELPKAQFESVRPKVEQADIDYFFKEVATTDKISDWDKLGAVEGLTKLFSKEGGSVPTKSEIAKLEEVFGAKFSQSMLDKQTNWQKFKGEIPDLINLPRTLMSSFDMSMPLRQAAIQTVSHPIIASKAFKEMHKAFASPKAYETMKQELQARPNAELYRDTKLHIPSLEIEYKPNSLKAREDGFVSRFLQTTRMPVFRQIGAGVKMSERAALTYLSKIRADVFDMYAGELQKSGLTPEKDGGTYKALADWINISTGRGQYGSLERFAPTASALLFSPRLLKARLDILNPMTYVQMPKEVRVMAFKDMAKFGSAVTGLLTLAKAGGANVETDARSTDFGKIKIGNTRYEVTGGIQPFIRFAEQFRSGQRKTANGKIVEMDNSSPYAGNRWDNLERFVQGKLNPQASLIVDLLKGQNFIGEDITLEDEVLSRTMPLYLQDAADAFKQEGLIKGLSVAIPSFYGIGTNTYPPKSKPVFKMPTTTAPKLKF